MANLSSQPRLGAEARTAGRDASRSEQTGRRAVALRPERMLARGVDSDLVLTAYGEGSAREVVKRLNKQALRRRGALRRFLDEIRTATSVRGTGFLPARRIRRGSGEMALVMPWVDGPDLMTFLVECMRRGRVPKLDATLAIATQMVEALDQLHSGPGKLNPLVHGAVQAENILLTSNGEACLIDFGACKPLDDLPDGPRRDLRALGELLAAMREGVLPGMLTRVVPAPGDLSPGQEAGSPRELALDRIISRCVHPPEVGGFPTARAARSALKDLSDASVSFVSSSALASEVQLVMGTRPGARARSSRPPFVPMIVSWLPPALKAASAEVIEPKPDEAEVTSDTKELAQAQVAWYGQADRARPWRPVDGRSQSRPGSTRDHVDGVKSTRPQPVRASTMPGRRVKSRKPAALGFLLFFAFALAGALLFMFGMHQGRKGAMPVATVPTPVVVPTSPAPAEAAPPVAEPEPEPVVEAPAAVVTERPATEKPKTAPVERRPEPAAKKPTPKKETSRPARTAAAPKRPAPAQLEAPPPAVTTPTPEPDFVVTPKVPPTVDCNVTSRPIGASVSIDGEYVGLTPLTVSMDEGQDIVSITVFLDGHGERTRKFRPSKSGVLNFNLED